MFALGGLGAGGLLLLHLCLDTPRWPTPWVPLVFLLTSVLALAELLRRPDHLVAVVRVALWVGVLIQWAGAWLPIAQGRGVTELPPVEVVLLPLMMFAAVFLPRREGPRFALMAWMGLALPVLGQLALDPQQLQVPRSLHLAVGLGPAAAVCLILLPLFQGIERHVHALEGEARRLQQLAERDALTGLYNRRAGEVWLQDAVQRRSPGVGLILFDVDHFKRINDGHGHDAGDAVLREIAARCATAIRSDDLLMRWGGEEFLVLARGIDRAGLAVVAESLRQACRRAPIAELGLVTASFGATLWKPEETIQTTLQRADQAMYAAKKAGRDRVQMG